MIAVEDKKLKRPKMVYREQTLPATHKFWNLQEACSKKSDNISNWTDLTVEMFSSNSTWRKAVTQRTIDNFRNIMRIHGFNKFGGSSA